MKNTISIHNDTIFNKEHDFRKGNGSFSYVDAEKSKDNVYFEKNEISKEDESNVYQMVISFNGNYDERILRNALVEYLETFQNRVPAVMVNYGAIHCDEKNMLPHSHLTYTKVDEISNDFLEREKEYLNILFKENLMQEIKKYLNV